MKFVRLNEGTNEKIKHNFSSVVGKYILFYRNGYFLGKLIEAYEPCDYYNCNFMFEDVHHLKGKFITLDEFINDDDKFKDHHTWIVPEDKKWEEVKLQRVTSENETIAIKVISEIYYNQSLKKLFLHL